MKSSCWFKLPNIFIHNALPSKKKLQQISRSLINDKCSTIKISWNNCARLIWWIVDNFPSLIHFHSQLQLLGACASDLPISDALRQRARHHGRAPGADVANSDELLHRLISHCGLAGGGCCHALRCIYIGEYRKVFNIFRMAIIWGYKETRNGKSKIQMMLAKSISEEASTTSPAERWQKIQ